MISDIQAVRWEKVYVFISSTFGDMHAERDYLVKRVFPALQDWCERRRLRLVDIDLRWGVTEADTTSKRAVEVCLERINECRPFFLCFLGQRHGWVPKVAEIAESTFTKFPALLEALQSNASVTELEIRHAILHPFTSTDLDPKHAQPETAEHAFFYFRDPGYLNRLHDAPRQLICTFTDEAGPEDETDYERQQRERARNALQTLREETIPKERRVIYQADWRTELSTPELAMPLECTDEWRSKWNRFAQLDLADRDERIPAKKLARANEYNAALTRGRLANFRTLAVAREQFPTGTELAQIIQHDLQAAIQTRFPTHSEVAQEDALQKELDQQDGFLQACSEGFIERTGDFDQLDGYVADEVNKLFVLAAPGGMGKSTLLANWIDRQRARIEPQSTESIHFRFIGASDRSTNMFSLWRSLLREIRETTNKLDEELPADPNKLRETLPELLAAIGQRGKTVIVLDALNQLETGLQDLHWLPRELPQNIKLIVSIKRDDAASEQLYQHFNAMQAVLAEVTPFANLEDRRRLVRAYLQQYLKELDEAHIATLIAIPGASNPLYLKVVLSELRVFGAFAGLAKKITDDFGDNPVSAFQGALKRLAADPAYAPIEPQRAVPLLFGLLAHARHGLSVEELTSLFVQALPLEDNEQGRQTAADTINLLLRQVRSFLARREGRYDYFYESFRLAAQQHCAISEDEQSATGWSAPQFHQLLAGLFSRQADPSGNRQWDGHSPRGLRDLPYHLLEGKQSEELFRVAREEVFLTAQKRAFPDEPELYLQTIQAAIEGAARIDDAARMAEFVLAHARRVDEAVQESPLDAMRSGHLGRAWKLADMYDPADRIEWYLLLARELNERGRSVEAQVTLEQAGQKQLPRLWGRNIDLLTSTFLISKENALKLTSQLLDDEARIKLCKALAEYGCFTEAMQTVQQIRDGQKSVKALKEIARVQARADYFAQAIQTAQQIGDKIFRESMLVELAQAQAVQQEAVGYTSAHALQAAQQIRDVGERDKSLTKIAWAHAHKEHFTQALQTAQQISYELYRSEALEEIAKAQARAGHFVKALQTALQILYFESFRARLLRMIITRAQVQDGKRAAAGQTLAPPLQISHEINDKEVMARALRELQAEADRAALSLKITRHINPEWCKEVALKEIVWVQAQVGHFAQALQTTQQIGDEGERASALLKIIGQAELGQPEAADQILAVALRVTQQFHSTWFKAMVLREIAKAQALVGQQEIADQTLDQALQLWPQNEEGDRAEVLQKTAVAQALAGNFVQALYNAQRISSEKHRIAALREIARTQMQAGQVEEADQTFALALQNAQRLSSEWSRAVTLRETAEAQAHAGRFAQALQTAQQIHNGEVEMARALQVIAGAQARAGHFAQALQTAQQINSAFSERAWALQEIAEVQARSGYFAQAIQTAQMIPDDMLVRTKVLQKIGSEQARAGHFTQALQTAQQIQFEGYRDEILEENAGAQARAGYFAQALQTAQQINSESSEWYRAGALQEIAVAQAQASRFAQALQTAQQIHYEGYRARTLPKIAREQAQAGQRLAADQTFAQAIQTAQQIRDKRYREEILIEIAEAQAQAGFVEQLSLTTKSILSDRSEFLTAIASAFAETGNKEGFKHFLTPCAYYLDAAYRMCGLLARLYPEQATAVAAVVTSAA